MTVTCMPIDEQYDDLKFDLVASLESDNENYFFNDSCECLS